MLIDYENRFSDAQAITTIGTAASTNYIDMVNVGDANEELYLHVTVNEAPTSAGAATLRIVFETDDNTSFSSPVAVFDTGVVAYDNAAFAQGAHVFRHRLPVGVMQRYARVKFVVATADLTAGKFDAYYAFDGNEHMTESR